MPFDTAESLRVALDDADRALRQAVQDGTLFEVMEKKTRVVVSTDC